MANRNQIDPAEFRDLYLRLMNEVKRRIDVILKITQGRVSLPQVAAYELCYLQLRMICELIALGCLAAHGDVLNKNSQKILRQYNADKIIKGLEKLHSDFYPVPGRQVLCPHTKKPIRVDKIKSGFLSKKELLSLYGECGDVLHRGSLLKLLKPDQNQIDFKKPIIWMTGITTLLNHHQIQLINPNQQFWVLMQSKDDSNVHGFVMEVTEKAST